MCDFLPLLLSREKTKVAKVGQGVEDGPDTKRAKLDSPETTMVKKKVLFCPVKEALEVDWSGEKAKAALKRTAPDYFLLQGKAWSWSHPRQAPALTTALWPSVDAVWVFLSPSQHRVVSCSLTEVWFLITSLNLSK